MIKRHIKKALGLKNINLDDLSVEEDVVFNKGKKIKIGLKTLKKKIAEQEKIEEQVKELIFTSEGLEALSKLLEEAAKK